MVKAVVNGGGLINMVVRRRKSLGGRLVTPVHINLMGHKGTLHFNNTHRNDRRSCLLTGLKQTEWEGYFTVMICKIFLAHLVLGSFLLSLQIHVVFESFMYYYSATGPGESFEFLKFKICYFVCIVVVVKFISPCSHLIFSFVFQTVVLVWKVGCLSLPSPWEVPQPERARSLLETDSLLWVIFRHLEITSFFMLAIFYSTFIALE